MIVCIPEIWIPQIIEQRLFDVLHILDIKISQFSGILSSESLLTYFWVDILHFIAFLSGKCDIVRIPGLYKT